MTMMAKDAFLKTAKTEMVDKDPREEVQEYEPKAATNTMSTDNEDNYKNSSRDNKFETQTGDGSNSTLKTIVGNLPDDNYARSELAPIMGPVPIGLIFYSFLWPIEWK